MANAIVEEQCLVDIANAIRTKNGTNDTYKPSEMANAILNIQSGGTSDNSYWLSILDRSITKLENEEITNLGNYAMTECAKLTSVNLPNVTKIGSYCFRQNTSLTDIKFSDSYTIGSACFIYCTALKNLNLSGLVQVNSNCFGYCSGLENVVLSDAEILQTYVFRECTSLKVVDLPKARTINQNVFLNDAALETIILRSEEVCTLMNKNAFTGSGIANGNGYVYVPKRLLSDDDETKDYRRATNWNVYASQLRAIEDYPEICGEV